jgi:PAS domain S-box-containing protein
MTSESRDNNILRALFYLFLLSVVVLDVEIVQAQDPEISLTAEERAWLKAHPKIDIGIDDTEPQIEKLSLSPSENEWLARNRTITLAFDGYYPPYSFLNENDEFQGLAVDVVQLIAKKTGLAFEYYQDAIWENLYEAAKKKDVDVVATMVQQPARLEWFLFADPYIDKSLGIVTRNNYQEIVRRDDIANKRVALVRDSQNVQSITGEYPSIEPIYVETVLDALNAVSVGQAEACIVNMATGNYLRQKYQIGNIRFAASYGARTSLSGFGVRNDWPELVSILNKGLESISEVERQEIDRKWLPIDHSASKKGVVLTEGERHWLQSHPVIRVASLADWAPMESVDKDGNYTGISIDYLRNIEEKLGVRFEFVQQQSVIQGVDQAKERAVDLISAIGETAGRSEFLSFSSPYFTSPTVILGRIEVPYIGDLAELEGKEVLVIKGSVHHENLIRDYPEMALVTVSSIHEALDMLESGTAFAYIGNLFAVSHNISQHGHSLVKVVGETPYRHSLGMASRNDWPVFAGILQKALDSISEEERKSIRRKWLSVTYEHGFDYSLVWKILALVIAVLAMFLYWNRRLTREITERKKAEDALQESNLLLSSILDSPENVLMLALDSNSNYLSYNKTHLRAMKKVYGVDIEIGKNLLSYISNEDDHLQIKSNHIRVLKGERFSQIQEYGLFEDRKWFELIFNPIIGISNKVTGFTVFGIDITERKKAEVALRRYAEEVQAANKAKSMFLSNMSHELRTPLNAILGFAQLMTRDVTIGKKQQEMINIISRSGKHLLSLITEILDFAKIESGRETLSINSFDLAAFLSEITEMFHSRIIDKGLFFTLEEEDDLPRYIKSDEGKLRQVLINLIGNAMKFTETGGVTLRVRAGALAENIQTLYIEVEDTGIGIDSNQVESIFDPFVQVGPIRTDSKGTGLGLAICKSFVELLDGEISVESKLGEGSLLRINLEVALAGATSIEIPGPVVIGLEPGQSMLRILIVEDNVENRLLLNSLLHQVGFDIRQAENGKEAVTLFEQWQPHFIWMDIRMPVMDGYQATAKIRSLPGGDTVKIVAITASAFGQQRSNILEAGCDEVIHKPYQPHEIFETMKAQLGVRYIYEEEIDKPPSSAEKVIDIRLAKEMATSLPEQLFDELKDAAVALDMEEAREALEQIAANQPELAAMLSVSVEDMDFAAIRRILTRE